MLDRHSPTDTAPTPSTAAPTGAATGALGVLRSSREGAGDAAAAYDGARGAAVSPCDGGASMSVVPDTGRLRASSAMADDAALAALREERRAPDISVECEN